MTPLTKSEIKAAQKLFGLSDWEIRVTVSNDVNGDCLGSTIILFEHKSAVITLYPGMISAENIALTGREDLRTILYHELAEVFVAQFLGFLPGTWRDTNRMIEYRDALAEATAKLVHTALKTAEPRKAKKCAPTTTKT